MTLVQARGFPPRWTGYINKNSAQYAGLVCWWPTLAANSGALIDVINGVNSTAYNGATHTLVSGGAGSVATFDGSNDYSQTASSSLLNSTTMTLSAWFYNRDLASANKMSIMKAKSGHTSPYYQYGYQFMNGTLVWNTNIGGTLHQQVANYPNYTWTHVAAVVNGAQSDLYVNGSLQVSNTYSGTITTYSTPLLFGANYNLSKNSTYCWNGMLLDVRFYNRALTLFEVYSQFALDTRWELYDLSEIPTRWWASVSPASGSVGLGRRMVIAQAGGVVAGDALTQTRKMVIAQAGGVVGLGGLTAGRGVGLSAGGLRNAPGGVTAGRGAHLTAAGGAVTGGALTAGRGAAVSVGGSVAAGSLVLLARREVLAAAGGVAGGAGVVMVAVRGMTVGASSVALAAAGLMLLKQVAQVAGSAAGGGVVAQRGEGQGQSASSATGGAVVAERGEGQQGSATTATGASATLAEGLGSAVQAGSAAGGGVGVGRGESQAQSAGSVTGGGVTAQRGEGVTVAAAAGRLASVGLGDGRGVSMAASSVALASEIVAKQLVLAVGAGAGATGAAELQRAVTAQITAVVLAQAAVVLSVELDDTETATALRNAAVEFLSEFGIACYIPFGVNYDADLSLDRGEGLATNVQAQRLANLVLALTRNQTAAGVAVNAAATALVETLSVAAAGHSATAAGLAAALMLGLSSEASRGVGVDVDLSLLHTIDVTSRAVATGWLPLASQRVFTADGVRVVEVGASLESIFRFWADASATTAILLHLERMVAQGGTALVGASGGLIAGRGERVTATASAGILAGVALAEGRALSVVSRAEGYSVVVVEVAKEIVGLGRAAATATVAQIVRADLGLDATARVEVGVVFALLGFLEVDGRVFAAVGLSEDRTLRMRARRSMWRVAIRSRLWRVAADSRRWRLEPRQWLWDVPVRSRVWVVSSKN